MVYSYFEITVLNTHTCLANTIVYVQGTEYHGRFLGKLKVNSTVQL